MRRVSYRPFVFLILFFFCVLSLPQGTAEKARSFAISSLSPSWKGAHLFRQGALFFLTAPISAPAQSPEPQMERERLLQENQLLRAQVESVREWLLNEDRIQDQLDRLAKLHPDRSENVQNRDFFVRRSQELCLAIDLQTRALPARVIFREPSSWSSTLWINLGERDNHALGREAIGKYSPVLVGTSIVGIVEYVGATKSRVRLITDARLTPSVRAVRGKEQNRPLAEHVDALLFALELRDDLFVSKEEADLLAQQLTHLQGHLARQGGDFYLAKGELHGSGQPLWRSRGQVLKGIGFNYDFADAEGPARDLRSGAPYNSPHGGEPLDLLRPGDLLITTGLDGVFPPGFRVATVSAVETLKEGASSYEIEAVSTAGDTDDLNCVFVLAPLCGQKRSADLYDLR